MVSANILNARFIHFKKFIQIDGWLIEDQCSQKKTF